MLQPITQNDYAKISKPVYEYRIDAPHTLPQLKGYFDIASQQENAEKKKSEKDVTGSSLTYDNLPYLQDNETQNNEKIYTPIYVNMRLNSVLAEISTNLDDWATNGIENSVISVYNIKKLLENNSGYFELSSNARLLSSALELIFENNNWEDI